MEEIVSQQKHYWKEIILLLATVILLSIFAELFFRIYYWQSGKIVAADDVELCFKDMKNPKNYLSVSPDNFAFSNDFDEHPLIGVVPKKNTTARFGKILQFSKLDNKGKLGHSLVYNLDYHNSQGLTNIKEFSLQKPNSIVKRIALFGDSFACGAEEPLKFNIGYVLEELVPNIEVLNFCVNGYGVDTAYARYVLESRQYSPDVIIFAVIVDDLKRVYDCPLFRPNLIISNNSLVIGERQWRSLKDFYSNYSLPKYESYFVKHILKVFDEHTKTRRKLNDGFELFKIMVDELKRKTNDENSTLIIAPLLQENPSALEIDVYNKMIELLEEKGVIFIDSVAYLNSQKKIYNNQSFYYIRAKDKLSHFSIIGNAVFAHGLKKTLESANIIQPLPDYFFANFADFGFLYFVPEDLISQANGEISLLPAFVTKDGAYGHRINLSLKN